VCVCVCVCGVGLLCDDGDDGQMVLKCNGEEREGLWLGCVCSECVFFLLAAHMSSLTCFLYLPCVYVSSRVCVCGYHFWQMAGMDPSCSICQAIDGMCGVV